MSMKDLSKAWGEAALRVLDTSQESELSAEQLSQAAGLRVRTGVAAGGQWEYTDFCTFGCSPDQ